MAQNVVPHFHNTVGAERIEIGVKEFQCMGALPPFDHPHIYLDMGADDEILCSYCSTAYRFDPNLGPTESRPPEALYVDPVSKVR